MGLVWVNKVYSKNFVTDFFQKIKNIVGGRLKAYEQMIDECIGETWKEFNEKYPTARNIRVDTERMEAGSVMVIITGEV